MVGSVGHVLCREGLSEERKRACLDSWRCEQVGIRVMSIENAKKREKVQRIAYDELGV
jgi:hypothetical protein